METVDDFIKDCYPWFARYSNLDQQRFSVLHTALIYSLTNQHIGDSPWSGGSSPEHFLMSSQQMTSSLGVRNSPPIPEIESWVFSTRSKCAYHLATPFLVMKQPVGKKKKKIGSHLGSFTSSFLGKIALP